MKKLITLVLVMSATYAYAGITGSDPRPCAGPFWPFNSTSSVVCPKKLVDVKPVVELAGPGSTNPLPRGPGGGPAPAPPACPHPERLACFVQPDNTAGMVDPKSRPHKSVHGGTNPKPQEAIKTFGDFVVWYLYAFC